jgi:hypothetical protein
VKKILVAALLCLGSVANADQAVSVGAGTRYICQTSAPAPVGRARNWVRCSDGAMMFTSALNLDLSLSSGGGGGGSISLTCGSGLTCSPSTITGTGTISSTVKTFDFQTWAQTHPSTSSTAVADTFSLEFMTTSDQWREGILGRGGRDDQVLSMGRCRNNQTRDRNRQCIGSRLISM